MKKARIKGHDDSLALLLFMLFLVSVLFILDAADNSEEVITSDQILKKLVVNDASEGSIAFVIRDRVDPQRLADFASKDYDQMKEELGVDYDFVVYFEDQSGNVVPFAGKYCVGSPKSSVGGISCG
ncbi:hypothetical protein JXB11_01380 [Candidatus Woesearchaeota archaeon]|nr:hypothetical protein [Candidatus Woesearchaeota archaeon]